MESARQLGAFPSSFYRNAIIHPRGGTVQSFARNVFDHVFDASSDDDGKSRERARLLARRRVLAFIRALLL